MQRYFAGGSVSSPTLSDGDIHHISYVMRNKIGDQIEVVVNDECHLYEIKSFNPLKISYLKKVEEKKELDVSLTLFFALAKGDKIEFVIQKAAELGASKVVLIRTKRDIVKLTDEDFIRKLKRYELIAKEASEQSHRSRIISVEGIYDLKKIPPELLCEVNYAAYETLASEPPGFSLKSDTKSASVLIGSEGGLDKEEVETLAEKGFQPISLGHRILRTETAAVYALSVLSYLIESR